MTPTSTPSPTLTPVGTVIVSGQSFSADSNLVVDTATNYLFFTSGTQLKGISTLGGSVTVMDSLSYGISDLDSDGYNLFYPAYTALYKIPLGGGSHTAVINSSYYFYKSTLDSSNVYFIASSYFCSGACSRGIVKISKGGGTNTGLATIPYSTYTDIFLAGSTLIFDDTTNGYVIAVPSSGGSPTTIVTGLSQPWGLVTNGAIGFVADMGNGRILSYNTDGSNLFTVASGLISPKYLWYDSDTDYIYFSDPGSNSIKKVLYNGGPITTLRTGLNNPGQLVTDSTYVYWINGDGCIYRCLK
jgi:hypothetical protein